MIAILHYAPRTGIDQHWATAHETMPGLIHPEDSDEEAILVDYHRQGSYRESKLLLPHGHGAVIPAQPSLDIRTQKTTAAHCGPPSVPIRPPPLSVPRAPSSTAYGLNEPQWIPEGPAPMIYELSPYSRVALPPLVDVHPMLAFDMYQGGNPALTWTIDQPPKYAIPTPGRLTENLYHWKSFPATNPPTSAPLSIRIESFSSLIIVSPSEGGVVTIHDVLSAIYTGARRGATERFCLALGLDPRMFNSNAMKVYGRMVTRDSDQRGTAMGQDEVSSNVRSTMGFQTRWAGLAPSRREQDVWALHTLSIARWRVVDTPYSLPARRSLIQPHSATSSRTSWEHPHRELTSKSKRTKPHWITRLWPNQVDQI